MYRSTLSLAKWTAAILMVQGDEPRNLFAYWSDLDHSAIEGFKAHWLGACPEFKIYGDAEIISLLHDHFPLSVELYRHLNIPAAKSNLARLMVLYARGGAYIDCHCACTSSASVQAFVDQMRKQDVVLVDSALRRNIRPSGSVKIMNSILFARPKQRFIRVVMEVALRNLRHHWRREIAHGSSPYDIWELSGSAVYNAVVFNGLTLPHIPSDEQWPFSADDVRSELRSVVTILREEKLPIVRYAFQSYREPGRHWSERQKSEPLFLV